MTLFLRTLTAGGAVAVSLAVPQTAAAAEVELGEPLAQAHAHNDYEHERPLLDALEHGFTSVEADVWLVDGELRVAHDLVDAEPGVTPEPLSLDPLAERVAANGGSVYRGWDGSLQLLIDTGSDGPATCAAVDEALRAYPQLMTRWTDGRTKERAVTAVISWRELVRAGVDHVDTDDLAGLQAFLLAEDPDEQRAAA